jgi:hypothetical protein
MESSEEDTHNEQIKRRNGMKTADCKSHLVKRCWVKGWEYVNYSGKNIDHKSVGDDCKYITYKYTLFCKVLPLNVRCNRISLPLQISGKVLSKGI